MKFRPVKYTAEELRTIRRLSRHQNIGIIALCVPLILSGIILVSGNYLSEFIKIQPDSILFRLWPYNSIYFRQFVGSPYTSSEIDWFFTVVSCSNLVWLLFFVWKFVFELFRRDVAFPSGDTPGLTKFAVGIPAIIGAVVIGGILTNLLGFYTHDRTIYGLSFGQSITVSAFKAIFAMMALVLYVPINFLFEYGGVGLRYLLAKKVGWFLADR